MRYLLPVLLLALPLCAQTVTFSPYDRIGSATAWSVTACLSAMSPGTTLPGGKLYQALAIRGANPLPYSQALALIHEEPGRSIPARLIKYVGWAAVAGGFLLQTDIVRANPKIQVGLQLGGAFLSVVVPLAKREVPGPRLVEQQLIGPFLIVPAGDCASGVILAGPGAGFQMTM